MVQCYWRSDWESFSKSRIDTAEWLADWIRYKKGQQTDANGTCSVFCCELNKTSFEVPDHFIKDIQGNNRKSF